MLGVVTCVSSILLMALNSFIYPHTRFVDSIEADCKMIESHVSKTVNLGASLGTGCITIQNTTGDGLIPMLTFSGKEYKLFPEKRHAGFCYSASVSLLDLDSDGRNEILVHDGDGFTLYIYGVKDGVPVLLGEMGCNAGIIFTEDGYLITRIGSQGIAEMARLENGELKIRKDFSIDFGEDARQNGREVRSVKVVRHDGSISAFQFSFDSKM